MKRNFAVSFLWAALLAQSACKGGESPAKLSGNASLRLADGSPISQTATDEYNPYVVKMPDGFLMLVFGSDRSCGGCSAGTHNIFVARSVAAYNNDQKIPAFNNPVVVTLAATPLNYASAITFAATQNGTNLRIFLNNAQGIIQFADYLATGGTFNTATLTSITNSVWRRLTIVGIDDLGTGLYGRSSSGQVYWLNPAILNIALNAMTGTGYASVARVAPAQSSMQDGYVTLQNGTVSTSSYSTASSTLTKLQSTLSTSKVTAKALSIAHTGNAAGDFVVLSAADAGKTTQDLYVVEGTTPAQTWSDLSNKPASGISAMPAAVTDVYAWYELDGNLNDSSGSGNNGFLPTTPFSGVNPLYTTDRHGVANAAANFTGTQYFANNYLAKCDVDFTISVWVRPTSVAAAKGFMGSEASPGSDPGFEIWYQAGGQTSFRAFYNGNPNIDQHYAFGPNLSAAVWQNITYVNDGALRQSRVYVNGVPGAVATNTNGSLVCSGGSPVTGAQQWRGHVPFLIGLCYAGSFDGQMDDLRFYNRKLTATEIQVLATQ